jgi:hypothetical protein
MMALAIGVVRNARYFAAVVVVGAGAVVVFVGSTICALGVVLAKLATWLASE